MPRLAYDLKILNTKQQTSPRIWGCIIRAGVLILLRPGADARRTALWLGAGIFTLGQRTVNESVSRPLLLGSGLCFAASAGALFALPEHATTGAIIFAVCGVVFLLVGLFNRRR